MDSLTRTFDYLATTENEASVSLLMAALDHRDRAVADGALEALLRRQSTEACAELIRRWHLLNDRWKQITAERPGVLAPELKVAFHSSDEQLIRNAADAAVATADYELSAMFALAAADRLPLRRRLAGETLLRLAELLYDELHGLARGRVRHDPQCIRDFMVGNLESPVTKYHEHHSREILEAFLLLAPRECATMRHLLHDAQESSHQPLCDQLLRSTRPGVIRLLLSLLDDPRAPLAPLRIMGRRRDVGFFRQLCKKLVDDRSPHLDANLARLDSLAWLDDQELSLIESLSEAEQPGLVHLVVGARLPAQEKLRVLKQLLAQEAPLGRHAAAKAMFSLFGKKFDWLVLDLIGDPCPLVQAEAARHLRVCDVPDAVATLLKLLDSPHVEVQVAARESLEEFSLVRYLHTFDSLTEHARINTGQLVKRVNPQVADELQIELIAPGRARRLRALQVVDVLDVAPQVMSALCELCNDDTQPVRLAAARLLGQCTSPDVVLAASQKLRELLADENNAVQHAAEQALQQLTAVTRQSTGLQLAEALK